MATVTAAALSLEKTLEELITEFNNLRSDVSTVTLESLISAASSSVVFEGDTDDSYETTLTVVDPTADRTITLPNVTGTVVTTANAGVGATTTTFADLDQFLINDGGVLKKMSLTTVLSSLPALLPASANANALGSASLEWSDLFLGDGAVISLGNSQDVTLTHVADVGLTITHVGTGDNLPIVLQLKSEENAITVNEVIASIEFAAGDSDGTDGATVAAGIHAIAEGTFAADANATKLVFTTGVSETAASSATAKMTLSSAGLLTLADDLILKDAATIGVTSSTSAIGIASTGIVTFVDDILIKDVGTIGSATTPAAVTIAANGGITLSGTLGVGAITTTGAFKGADGYTIGNASVAAVMTLASSGIVTFVDDIILKDTATIGVTSSTGAISIASTGIVTLVDDLLLKDACTIGTATTAGAIAIAADGTVDLDTAGATVASAVIKTVGKESIWVPASAMQPTTSNGCSALETVETTSGRPDMVVLDFDKDADEFAQFSIAFPKSYNLGTITFQVFWSGIAATTDCDWQLQGVAMNDNETIDVAYGTAVVVTDNAQGAVEELYVSAESGAVTIAGTPADNDLCYFRIGRDVSGDNMDGDARLHGLKIFFTTDSANDA